MAKKVVFIIVLFAVLIFFSQPGVCQDAAPKDSMKSVYFKWIHTLAFIFVILLVWEILETLKKRKMQLGSADMSETISVVEDEKEDDPFKTLLREETEASAPSVAPDRPKEEVRDILSEIDDISEEPRPALSDEDLVVREDRGKPRKSITVDIPAGSSMHRESPAAPVTPHTSAKPERAESDDDVAGEDGWRELMQRASQKTEELPSQSPVEAHKPAASAPVSEDEGEDEDPWKALLRKSKQEEVGVTEEDKPWSVFMKSDKSSKESTAGEREGAVPAAPELDTEKQQDRGPRQKPPSQLKKNQSPFIKRASRVISLNPQKEDADSSEDSDGEQ